MTTMRLRSLVLAALVAALAACAAPEPKAPPPPAVDVVALVASIRAAAGPDDAKDELAIKPLRDPMVEDQRAQAQRLEREGQSRSAISRVIGTGFSGASPHSSASGILVGAMFGQ